MREQKAALQGMYRYPLVATDQKDTAICASRILGGLT